jgi:putative ABC transport system permease protein
MHATSGRQVPTTGASIMNIASTIRYAIRRLARAPGFAAAALLSITLGIGATTAVFTVVNAVLLRPLPYPRADQLVDLSHTLTISGVSRVDQSDATFLYYRREARSFSDVGIYRVTGVNVGRLTGVDRPDSRAERVSAGVVSASTVSVLGATPLAGRTFRDADNEPGAAPVVLISQRLWERRFGGDPSAVGRPVDVDGVPHEIVGIMPAAFDLPASHADVWLPVTVDPAHTASAAFDYRGVGRLRDGVSTRAAAAELQRLLPRVPEAFPGRLTTAAIAQIRMRAVVEPLRDVVVGDVGRVLWVVLGAVACVLLVACANVMNLFLVRAEGRQHELAVRRALGASRGSLAWEHIAEGVVLAGVGGVLALGLAFAGVRALRSLDGQIQIPRLAEVQVDLTVLAAALAVTCLTTVLVAAMPALRAASTAASAALGEMGRAVTAARGRQRARHALVAVQIALALVLLAGAGLMGRSFERLRAVPPGIDAAHAFAFRVALPRAGYGEPGNAARFVVRALDEIASVPGVRAAGVVSKLPLVADARQDTAVFVEDRPLAPGTMPDLHQVAFTTPGYFRAMGVPLLEGRAFDALDPARAPREVVVSRSIAARYWPTDRAIGKRVRLAPFGDWFTVVGVAGDVRGSGLDQPPDEIVYIPLVVALGGRPGNTGASTSETLWTPRDLAFVVRTDGDDALVGRRVQDTVRGIDPGVPAYAARPMREVVAQAAIRTTLTLVLLAVASGVALALGAVGIFGVVSYVVSLRTREIAVRLALGAQPSHVRRLVSAQAAVVVGVGIAGGLAGALGLTRVLAALLFGVTPIDPPTLAGAAVMLAVVAGVAAWVPAHRASRLDPAQALRSE